MENGTRTGLGREPRISWWWTRIAYAATVENQRRLVVEGVAGPRFAAILVSPVVYADGHLRYLAAEQTETGPMLVAVEVPGFGFNEVREI